MLSTNVGSFSLGGKPLDGWVSAAGHARPGLWAVGDGPGRRHALPAPDGLRADGRAGDAMPSRDGTCAAQAIQVFGNRAPSR